MNVMNSRWPVPGVPMRVQPWLPGSGGPSDLRGKVSVAISSLGYTLHERTNPKRERNAENDHSKAT